MLNAYVFEMKNSNLKKGFTMVFNVLIRNVMFPQGDDYVIEAVADGSNVNVHTSFNTGTSNERLQPVSSF